MCLILCHAERETRESREWPIERLILRAGPCFVENVFLRKMSRPYSGLACGYKGYLWRYPIVVRGIEYVEQQNVSTNKSIRSRGAMEYGSCSI